MSKDNFIFNTTSGIRFGSGMSKLCSEEVSKKLGPNILFITDKDLMSLKLTEPTLNELRKFSSLVEIFQDVEADPSIKTLLNAIEMGKKINATGVIGFGANVMGTDGAFSGILGLRFEYGFTDAVSDAGAETSAPIYDPAVFTEGLKSTNPIFAGVVFELNWGVGAFAVAKCGGRPKFIMF